MEPPQQDGRGRSNEPLKSTMRSDSDLFRGSSQVQATLSAGQSGIGYKKARDIAAPAHLVALKAANPRIQAMIQDAVRAGLLLQHPQETRFDAVLATATSTYLDALDDEDRGTALLCVQKAAQAAEEAWQQTIGRHHDNVRPRTPWLRLSR